jgi:hypothetical protein
VPDVESGPGRVVADVESGPGSVVADVESGPGSVVTDIESETGRVTVVCRQQNEKSYGGCRNGRGRGRAMPDVRRKSGRALLSGSVQMQ